VCARLPSIDFSFSRLALYEELTSDVLPYIDWMVSVKLSSIRFLLLLLLLLLLFACTCIIAEKTKPAFLRAKLDGIMQQLKEDGVADALQKHTQLLVKKTVTEAAASDLDR
jgi:hypothetical protein